MHTLLFSRTKKDDFVFLVCPRCACILEGTVVVDMPRIQAGTVAPARMSRVGLSTPSARDADAISARMGGHRRHQHMVNNTLVCFK